LASLAGGSRAASAAKIVVLLFGSMARDLGFVVTRAQTEFPDREAMREMRPDRWERVRIEFEYR
jgi:hypothetical protein